MTTLSEDESRQVPLLLPLPTPPRRLNLTKYALYILITLMCHRQAVELIENALENQTAAANRAYA